MLSSGSEEHDERPEQLRVELPGHLQLHDLYCLERRLRVPVRPGRDQGFERVRYGAYPGIERYAAVQTFERVSFPVAAFMVI